MSFEAAFQRIGDDISPFCLGIDPAPGLLTAAGLPNDKAGLRIFYERLLESTQGLVSVVKPQVSYFERFGPDGLVELKRLIDMAHDRGYLVIVDAKRGDIDASSAGYAEAYLGPSSYYNADALTVTAYLGFGALDPIFDRAAEHGKGVFVVVMSSNSEGQPIQTAILKDRDQSVAAYLVEEINAYNERRQQKVIGAVLGATRELQQLEGLIDALGQNLILCPGIGHQGATFDDLGRTFSKARRNLIPIMARSIVREGFSNNILRSVIHERNNQAVTFRRGSTEPLM